MGVGLSWTAVTKRRKGPRPERATQPKPRDAYVPRPFDGLADECEWIALRELVPAASAPLRLAGPIAEQYGDRPVVLATVLPMAWPAMTKPDGRVFIALQRHVESGDPSRDLAVALLCGLDATPGEPVTVPALPGTGPRLQDLLADAALDVTVHDGFSFWLDPGEAEDPNVKASLDRANAQIFPTVRMSAARAAYWCRLPGQAHVRWVLPDDEDRALDALSRLSAAGVLPLGDGTRFAGMFRAHGRLVPVWDLPTGAEAGDWEAPLAEMGKRYAEALSVDVPLSSGERRARQGLLGRQKTLR
jgi:hypothetical protein